MNYGAVKGDFYCPTLWLHAAFLENSFYLAPKCRQPFGVWHVGFGVVVMQLLPENTKPRHHVGDDSMMPRTWCG